jgi:lysophospholipase L1-like esterase
MSHRLRLQTDHVLGMRPILCRPCMRPHRRVVRRLGAGLTALVAVIVVLASTATAAASQPRFNPPKAFTLALGDSLAFGQDETLVARILSGTYSPAAFDSGYVDLLEERLASVRPEIQTVNYSCPGETTGTFVAGGCWLRSTFGPIPLHDDYPLATSQLAVALEFLQQYPGQVSPITLAIGADDFLVPFLIACGGQLDCFTANFSVPALLARAHANLDTILTALTEAAPSSEIVMVAYYNPFGLDPGPLGLFSDAIVTGLNDVIVEVAAAHGARVADAFTPINLGAQPETLCALTLVCTLGDVHPSKAGYAVIADQFWAASGYERLEAE